MLRTLRNRLLETKNKLVLAESCTSGLVAALLGSLPGISEVLCGSLVVYRTKSKEEWLGLPKELLEDPAAGPVSAETTLLLARAALQRTSEATLGAAITGDLGPGVEESIDGRIFIAIVMRSRMDQPLCREFRLKSPACRNADDIEGRGVRQREAAELLLQAILDGMD